MQIAYENVHQGSNIEIHWQMPLNLILLLDAILLVQLTLLFKSLVSL